MRDEGCRLYLIILFVYGAIFTIMEVREFVDIRDRLRVLETNYAAEHPGAK